MVRWGWRRSREVFPAACAHPSWQMPFGHCSHCSEVFSHLQRFLAELRKLCTPVSTYGVLKEVPSKFLDRFEVQQDLGGHTVPCLLVYKIVTALCRGWRSIVWLWCLRVPCGQPLLRGSATRMPALAC
ncbi:hypothetical protein N7495_003427 [Penicillium taxi]|uniref:uncharacterized protein n=1 Tax=Penicillium taxi TaxID=168475 RepID=UPI002544F4B5|nr:uncharacterized protein N7495_003427 [Penicillium taxi]KAJ5902899.1 hypothetical protein N7495_003427 [Penicillium taxi]